MVFLRLTTLNAGDTLCWHVEYYVVGNLQKRIYFLLMPYCYSFAEERKGCIAKVYSSTPNMHMHCHVYLTSNVKILRIRMGNIGMA